MQLNKQLILFRYILGQFGYETFEELRENFNNKETGTSSTGYTFFAATIMSNSKKKVEDNLIQLYDEAIQGYEKKLRENRAEPFFSFKYYQWFSLLFTEYFFDLFSSRKETLIQQLNVLLEKETDFNKIETFTENDLKKLAYWMATGSGKTLIMHCNYWQAVKYFKNDWENIILITPNEGLSRQHYESFTESGIDAKLYSGSEESLKTKEGEVLILEITKLVKDKAGEGVSVDVDYFSESKNLVFIDEGHKGSKSEEQTWKNLRQHLTRGDGSFTFEYSATFGQVITDKNKFLLNEYAKSIIFDYSYRHFYTDGYGKDFSVFNLDADNEYSEEQNRLLLTGSLLGYYEQLILFEQYQKEIRQYNVEKPLWVFVGSRVISSNGSLTQGDKQNISDVTRIVNFFKFILSSPQKLQQLIDKILSEQSDLRDKSGDDIFKPRFQHLKENKPVAEEILNKVFNGIGSLEAFQVKQAEGEIALKTKTSDNYFAVINIGDVPKYAKTLEADTNGELSIQDDNFSRSLFQAISETNSTINILIGSKKFIEGWNSWRVSSMGLMNMGKSEGAQIIQLFGRGVRLKGKNFSLKREEANAPYFIRALQNISIMGLNASYMNRFLVEIENEVPEYTEYPIEIKLNNKEKWNGQIMTFRKHEDKNFKDDEIVELAYSSKIARRVTIDLRNKVSIAAGGFNSQVADDAETYNENFLKQFIKFIDTNALVLEANRYKLIKGYSNLIIKTIAIEELIKDGSFNLYSHKEQFGLGEAISGKVHSVAVSLVKDYINKFYADKEKEFLSDNLTYDLLDHEVHAEMFPASQKMIVKVPIEDESFIEELKERIDKMYEADDRSFPTIHFSHHLYSPIASTLGKNFKEYKTVPTRLNEGERDFLEHLKQFVNKKIELFNGKELFVLRNLSLKGIGFFMESSSFYPDFILWVIDKKKQYIYFLDPKGILLGDNNWNNPKIHWCRDSAPELGKRIQQVLTKDKKDISVSISAFILSDTAFNKVRDRWGEGTGTTKEDFANNNVLFIENNKDYLFRIFKNLEE